MNRMDVINRAMKWGLILGLLMSASKVLETEMLLSGSIANVLLIVPEMIFFLWVYLYVCYKANVENKMLSPEPSEYKLRNVINYTVVVSIFAGVIVGIASHVYISVGYGGHLGYVQQVVESVTSMVDNAQFEPELREKYFAELDVYKTDEGVEALGEYSIFQSIISIMMNYIFGGFISALLISRYVKRKGNSINEEEQSNE